MSAIQLERGRFFGSTLARRQLTALVVSETAYPPSLVIPPHEHELPIGEVALQTGFSDQSHLSRQFRAATGHTPASYRRWCRTR